MHRVILGDTGIETSYLSIGSGSEGYGGNSDQTRLGFDKFVELIQYAYDKGVTFFDTADGYGSHPHFKAATKVIGRENVQITSKTTAKTVEKAESDVNRFLQELGTDHLDILLLHCMTNADWVVKMRPVMEYLSECQRKGIVRVLGVSCHNFGAFEAAANEEWVEVVLARINYDGVHMDETPENVIRVMDTMHARGKGIYGMKVIGQSRLAGEYKSAIKFVYDLDCVDAMTIGMLSRADVDQNVAWIGELHAGSSSGAPVTPESDRASANR